MASTPFGVLHGIFLVAVISGGDTTQNDTNRASCSPDPLKRIDHPKRSRCPFPIRRELLGKDFIPPVGSKKLGYLHALPRGPVHVIDASSISPEVRQILDVRQIVEPWMIWIRHDLLFEHVENGLNQRLVDADFQLVEL